MPYVEVLAPRAADTGKRKVVEAVTEGIVRGFDVSPSTVTIYFVPITHGDYAHAGQFGLPASDSRVFVKVHAYRRSADQRRAVAESMTPASPRASTRRPTTSPSISWTASATRWRTKAT